MVAVVLNKDFLKYDTERKFTLAFLDPPYFIDPTNQVERPEGGEYAGMKGVAWDIFEDMDAFKSFTSQWLEKVESMLTPNGSIYVCGSYHRLFTVGAIMQERGWFFLSDIVWIKPNPTPNFKGVRYRNGHEQIIWAIHRRRKPYIFNYQLIKKLNRGKQVSAEWRISPPLGDKRIKLNGKTAHRSQKPELLLARIILASTNPGDWVLDPFAGTGTTAVVAEALGRNSVSIEKESQYTDIIKKRLAMKGKLF